LVKIIIKTDSYYKISNFLNGPLKELLKKISLRRQATIKR